MLLWFGRGGCVCAFIKDLVFTWLHHPRLGPQVGQVDVGLPAVNDRVWVFAGAVGGRAVCHRHLREGKERRE